MRNANTDSVLRSNFAGGRIRKTETNFFEISGGRFPPCRRVREEARRTSFLDFWWAGQNKTAYSYSRFSYEALLPQGSPFYCDETGTKSILMSMTIAQECEVHTTIASIRLE